LLPTLAERITVAEKSDLPLEDFLLGMFHDEASRRRDASTSRQLATIVRGPAGTGPISG